MYQVKINHILQCKVISISLGPLTETISSSLPHGRNRNHIFPGLNCSVFSSAQFSSVQSFIHVCVLTFYFYKVRKDLILVEIASV